MELLMGSLKDFLKAGMMVGLMAPKKAMASQRAGQTVS